MPYILDTNIFIEAKDSYYMFDTFPGFWDWLIIQNRKGMIYSVQAVDGELKKGKDDLSDWATKRGDAFFLPPNESTAGQTRGIKQITNIDLIALRQPPYCESALLTRI